MTRGRRHRNRPRATHALMLTVSHMWRRQMLARLVADNGPVCFYCGEGVRRSDRRIEHKVPVSRGGTNDYENLALSCDDCDWRKHWLTADEFIAVMHDDILRKAKLRETAHLAHGRGREVAP